jgi:hypothetical protein
MSGRAVPRDDDNATDRMVREGWRDREDAMFAAVDVGIWYCDLPFDELTWNRKVKEHFWLPPDARVTIDVFYQRLHPDDRERTRRAIEESIASHTPYDIEYRTVAPPEHPEAGGIRWLRAIGYTGYDPTGTPIRFDGVTVDVSSAKVAAAAIAKAEEALRIATREEAEVVETLHTIGSTLAAEVELERIVQTVTDESTRLTSAQFGAFFYNVVNEKGEAYTLYTLSGVPREAFANFPMPRNTARRREAPRPRHGTQRVSFRKQRGVTDSSPKQLPHSADRSIRSRCWIAWRGRLCRSLRTTVLPTSEVPTTRPSPSRQRTQIQTSNAMPN